MSMDAFRAARYRLLKRRPYFSAALMAMEPVDKPDLPAPAAVDKHWRIYIGADFASLPPAEAEAVILHELEHLLRDHHERAHRSGAKSAAWNLAADAEINGRLRSAGEALPKSGIFPDTLGQPDDRLAEEYYHQLTTSSQPAACGRPQSDRGQSCCESDGGDQAGAEGDAGRHTASTGSAEPASGAAGEQPSPTGHGTAADADGDASRTQAGDGSASSADPSSASRQAGASGASSGADRDHVGPERSGRASSGDRAAGGRGGRSPVHGSGAGAEPGSWEEPAPEDGGPPGVGDAEARLVRRATAEAVRRYIATHGRGSVPGDVARWADDVLAPPKVDWRRELASAIRAGVRTHNGCTDYTYARRSRRQGAIEHRLPATIAHRPTVAVVIDTSGSIGDAELRVALAEVRGIIRALGGDTVELVACDTRAQARGRVSSLYQARKLLAGGGGTDMWAGIQAALSARPRPSVVVVLTDGDTSWPDRGPVGARVIVATTRRPGPAWAKTITIEP